MMRRPPRSTQGVSSAASDVYKRQKWQRSYHHPLIIFNKEHLHTKSTYCSKPKIYQTKYSISFCNGFVTLLIKVHQNTKKYKNETTFIQKNISAYCSCLLYTSPSPRDLSTSRMPSSA
eukprot:TRINITY_DN39180_c0_g1_i1.p2 TRINITY_DN39180_c0_g1~~TRINITY_DN39180_c0_g1_i1.p2  ORF type:complete len:118 (+),score=17.64 TRINITY_DN39180_c0_g1_i1:151-504(+)